MRHHLPHVQSICLDTYIDCKRRSKKHHGLPLHQTGYGLTDDERLIYLMLENSSITESNPDSPKCFTEVDRAIHRINMTLCPGQWCTRGHCKAFSGHCAYNCRAGKKPAICKEYKEYIRKKQERDQKKQDNEKP